MERLVNNYVWIVIANRCCLSQAWWEAWIIGIYARLTTIAKLTITGETYAMMLDEKTWQPDPIHCHKQLQDSIDYPILLLSSATTVSQPTIYYCVLLFDNFNLQTIVYFYLQINLIFQLLSYNNSLLLYENFFMNVRKVKHTMRKEYKESRIARINEDFQGSLSPQPPLPYIILLEI